MIPVEAKIDRESDFDIVAVDANSVLVQLEYARSRIGFVILDSCRNNPFTRSFRAPVLGLARMDATRGTLIAYATSPGQVAYDGTGRNSPYTGALAEELRKPGVPVELMFKAVHREVMAETRDKQVPWEASSLTGDFFFEPGYVERRREPVSEVPEEPESAFREEPVIAFRKAPEIAGDRPAAAIGPSAEVVFWMSLQNSTNKEDFEEYLRRFPDGVFEGLARRRTDEFGQLALAAERLPEPELEAVGGNFFALKTSNVRDRPSTQAEIVGRLAQGEPVSVRGKAKGINWYLVARNDKEFGYVHGNLLARLNALVEPVGRVLMVRPVLYQARQMTEATRLIIAKLDQLPNTVVIESSKTPRAHDILIRVGFESHAARANLRTRSMTEAP